MLAPPKEILGNKKRPANVEPPKTTLYTLEIVMVRFYSVTRV